MENHLANVFDKLLFGSDFPYTNATECIEALYSINQLAQGSSMPMIPREAIRGIIERNSLPLLGLQVAPPLNNPRKATQEPAA